MAFMEGNVQKIDLIGMIQAARDKQDRAEKQKQMELQNQMMQEQIKAAEWQNLKDRERQTITLPAGPGLGGMREKQFLDQQAGYISGVSPTDIFNQWNQNFRQGMTAGGYGGGGGGDSAPQQDPYSNYAPGQLEQMNAINEYQPQKAKASTQDSANIAALLGELYRPGETSGAGGGSIKNPQTGTFKEFSETPIESRGTITDMSGNQRPTGIGAIEDYKNDTANTAEVNKILKDRAALAEKSKIDQMLYSNDAYVKLDSDMQGDVRKELPQFKKELESRNISFTPKAIELLIAKIKARK